MSDPTSSRPSLSNKRKGKMPDISPDSSSTPEEKRLKLDGSKNIKEEEDDNVADLNSAKRDLTPLIESDHRSDTTLYHEYYINLSRYMGLLECLFQPETTITSFMKADALIIVKGCQQELTKLYEVEERIKKDAVSQLSVQVIASHAETSKVIEEKFAVLNGAIEVLKSDIEIIKGK